MTKWKAYFKNKLDGQLKILIKNSSWVFFANMIGAGLAFFRSVVIARGFGAEILGTYVIIVGLVGIIQEVLNLNIGTPLIKYGADYQSNQRIDKLTALLKYSIIVSIRMAFVSIAAVAIATIFLYDVFISDPGLHWFVISYAAANSLNYLNGVSKAILRLYFKFKLNSLITIIADVIEFALVAAAALLYPKNLTIFLWAVLITRFLNTLVVNGAAFYELRNEFRPYLKIKSAIIKEDLSKIWSFIINNSISNTLKQLISQGDVLLLKLMLGGNSNAQVGFYRVAKSLAYSLLTITDPLVNSIYPQLSKLISEKRYTEIQKMLVKITKLSGYPSLIFLVITYFTSGWLIRSIYGQEFEPAATPFFWFMIGAVVSSVFFWTIPMLQSLGLVHYRLRIYIVAVIMAYLSGIILIPLYQSSGMAIGILIVNLIVISSTSFLSFKAIQKLKNEQLHVSSL